MASVDARADFVARRDIAVRLLSARGLRHINYAPMLHRILWYCSVPARPPHFASFRGNALLIGGCYGWFFFWLLIVICRDLNLLVILLSVCAVLSGVAMAGHYVHSARKHQLPKWSELQAEVFD